MRILYLLLAAVFAQSAAAQTAADPRWPEVRGPLSLVDRMMNSTTISRSGGLFELRRKTAELYTPAFSLGSYPEYSGKRLALDGDRLEFFSYALNSRLYKDAAVLLFTDGLFNDSDTLRYLKGVLAYDIHDFALAAKCFSEVPSSSPYHTKAQSFTELWNARPELPGYKDKSPWIAGAMSAIIPGSGKIYAGDLRSGVSTLLIVGALGAIAAESWSKLGPGDWRTISLSSLFALFHIANIYGSAVSVSVIKESYESAQKATLLFNLHLPLHQF